MAVCVVCVCVCTEPESDAFFDPRMTSAASKRLNRKSRATFDFVQEGVFQKQAEEFRYAAHQGARTQSRHSHELA